MFEDSFPGEKKDRRTSDRAFGVIVTILVHLILGLVVYYGRFTVRILPFEKEDVRKVVIVPPLNLAIPKVVGGRGLSEVPGEAPEDTGRQEARPEPETGFEAEAAPPAAEPGPPPAAGSAIPSLSSRFRESLAIHGRSDLTIPLAPPGTPAGPPGIHGGIPLPDFSKYVRGAYGGGDRYGGGRSRSAGAAGRQRVGVSIPLKDFDLLPWASIVIDRLQLHWNLPAVQVLAGPARISMVVVVKKSGELDSIEILGSTAVEALDQAALESVRSSLPFPALPAEFPGDLLELTLEFVYDD